MSIVEISKIEFSSQDKSQWMKEICNFTKNAKQGVYKGKKIIIYLPLVLDKETIEPFHIVTLACFIKLLKKSGTPQGSVIASENLISYMKEELNFSDYFTTNENLQTNVNFNDSLWNVIDTQILPYSNYISEYLRCKYFNDKDSSILKVCLDELFANIADHSKANGIAYSFIKFEENKNLIKVAFCDFGIGIPGSLKKAGININSNYIEEATKIGITSRSNPHNKGYGLDTVVSSITSSGHLIRIASGNELFLSHGKNKTYKTYKLDFEIPGTLVYFTLPVSSFEEIDIIDDFEL